VDLAVRRVGLTSRRGGIPRRLLLQQVSLLDRYVLLLERLRRSGWQTSLVRRPGHVAEVEAANEGSLVSLVGHWVNERGVWDRRSHFNLLSLGLGRVLEVSLQLLPQDLIVQGCQIFLVHGPEVQSVVRDRCAHNVLEVWTLGRRCAYRILAPFRAKPHRFLVNQRTQRPNRRLWLLPLYLHLLWLQPSLRLDNIWIVLRHTKLKHVVRFLLTL